MTSATDCPALMMMWRDARLFIRYNLGARHPVLSPGARPEVLAAAQDPIDEQEVDGRREGSECPPPTARTGERD